MYRSRMGFHIQISIHTPREGSDFIHISYFKYVKNFNPHSPRGERPYC